MLFRSQDFKGTQGQRGVRGQTSGTDTGVNVQSRVAAGSQSSRPRAQARVFAMTQQEAAAAPEVITGMLSIFGRSARILIDPGATHSFVSESFALYADREGSELDCELVVATPVGHSVIAKKVFKGCVIHIGEHELPADLICMEISDFDVILGMDWLSCHHATVDCYEKVVQFEDPDGHKFSFKGERRLMPSCVISAI